MSQLWRALWISAVATGVAAVVLFVFDSDDDPPPPPPPVPPAVPPPAPAYVDADALPEAEREALVHELGAQL